MATLVRVVNGDAYALTCAATPDEDDDESDVPEFCMTTFKSLKIESE